MITTDEALTLIEENKDIVILDVRTKMEFEQSHIEGAINLNFYSRDFNEEILNLDKDKEYIVICNLHLRSSATVDGMKHLGFKNVEYVYGGMEKWNFDNKPTV